LCTDIAVEPSDAAASHGSTAERQIQNRFRQFCSSLRKDSVTNYGSIC